MKTRTVRPTLSITYAGEAIGGVEPVPSSTYTRKVTQNEEMLRGALELREPVNGVRYLIGEGDYGGAYEIIVNLPRAVIGLTVGEIREVLAHVSEEQQDGLSTKLRGLFG